MADEAMMRNIVWAIAGFAVYALSAIGFSGVAAAQETTSSIGAAATDHPKPAGGGSYYIEFRVAEIGTYGHSYVMYGRLGGSGQPADRHYADLHPVGSYALMALGHVLPVPANTTWDPDVLKLPVASSYRRKLSAAEYQKLLAAIKRANANKQPYWNALTNNCNHYVAALARAIGMNAPDDLKVSYAFIPSLRTLNEPAQSATAATSPARKKTTPVTRTAAPATPGT
jgi:hypothetical protein